MRNIIPLGGIYTNHTAGKSVIDVRGDSNYRAAIFKNNNKHLAATYKTHHINLMAVPGLQKHKHSLKCECLNANSPSNYEFRPIIKECNTV